MKIPKTVSLSTALAIVFGTLLLVAGYVMFTTKQAVDDDNAMLMSSVSDFEETANQVIAKNQENKPMYSGRYSLTKNGVTCQLNVLVANNDFWYHMAQPDINAEGCIALYIKGAGTMTGINTGSAEVDDHYLHLSQLTLNFADNGLVKVFYGEGDDPFCEDFQYLERQDTPLREVAATMQREGLALPQSILTQLSL